MAASAHILRPPVHQGAVQQLVGRGEQEWEAGEIGILAYHVHRAGHLLEYIVIFLGVGEGLPLRRLLLVLHFPMVRHLVHQSRAACGPFGRLGSIAVQGLAQLFHFLRHLHIFLTSRREGEAVRHKHTVMILLAAPERLAEAVVADEAASARKDVPYPHPDRARHRLGIEGAPVHLTRLEFHHTVSPAREIAELVIAEAQVFGIAQAEALLPHSVAVARDEIAGVGSEIQMIRKEGVNCTGNRDEIGGNPLSVRDVAAEHIGLEIHEGSQLRRIEAVHIQHRVRIGLLRDLLLVRHTDLVEVLIGLAPESAAPAFVEGFYAAVFLLEEKAEGGLGVLAVVHHPVMAGLIVYLPANHRRVVPIALGQGRDYLPHIFPVAGGTPGGVLTAAVAYPHAVVPAYENLRMLFAQPHGRAGRRSAQNHLEPVAVGQGDGLVQPAEVIAALLRLKRGPGELGEMGESYAHRGHFLQVPLPLGLIPLLGIVIGSQRKEFLLREGILNAVPGIAGTGLRKGKGRIKNKRRTKAGAYRYFISHNSF